MEQRERKERTQRRQNASGPSVPSVASVPSSGERGQILVVAILILSVLLIIVPLMVMNSQREAVWSTAQKRTTVAFHLAEAATERGYLYVTQSTTVFQNVQYGSILTGYNFDQAYSDLSEGKYAIKIASGSSIGSVVITGVGKESSGNAIRTVEVTYVNAPFGNVAIWANGGVNESGNNFSVEWGAIMTPKSVQLYGRQHPQIWSAGSIDADTNGATPPNTDLPNGCFWHSYNSSIPPTPTIDFAYYKGLAQGTGTYYSGNQSFTLADNSGKTYYIDGNFSEGNNSYLTGNLIVTGDLTPPNGNWGTGSVTVPMPTVAWKQYCNDWSYYRTTYDASAPASWPGLTNTYTSNPAITVSLTKLAVYGFMYVGGNLNWGGGGGNADFVGVVYINGQGTLGANSHGTIYYNSTVSSAIHTSNVVLSRQSWKEYVRTWPSGI